MDLSRSRRATLAGSIAATLLFLATPGHAQPAPGDYTDDPARPAGRRGERIQQVLDAVNSGERAPIEALVKDAFGGPFREIPLEQHLGALGGFHDRSRGLDFYGVRRYVEGNPPETAWWSIAKNRLTGGWQGLTFTFDGTPEERITGCSSSPRGPRRAFPRSRRYRRPGEGRARRVPRPPRRGRGVLRAPPSWPADGEVVFEAARGIADRNHGVPMRLDSKLNLGSMDKMFTAVVIGQLVDEGKLSFQDPVSKFLGGKGWTKADLSKVRVEHLLSHTSGLGSYFNDTYERMARQLLRKVDDYKPLVAEETLAFEPGTKWQYSNTGFLLAGAVIEAVTGKDYFDVVRERVYARAGMPNSDSYDIDLVVPNLAIGYSRERTAGGAQWRANTFEHVIRGGPAGGGYSTARDLLAFAEAMRKGKLVSAATGERLWSAKPELKSPDYGYGFGVGKDALGRSAGHSGGFSGDRLRPRTSTSTRAGRSSSSRTWTAACSPVAQKLREVAGRIR